MILLLNKHTLNIYNILILNLIDLSNNIGLRVYVIKKQVFEYVSYGYNRYLYYNNILETIF